jgi:hypothetical protein
VNLESILKAMQAIGPATAAIGAVKDLIETGISLLRSGDQETAKEALADLIADNDVGHRRLQEKLQEAAKR